MAYTVEFCKQRKEMWLSAAEALATSKSYKMGTRQLERVDLAEVRRMINYWDNELQKAENGGKRQKMLSAVPRDL